MKSTVKQINWYYHRNGCATCGKSQDYLNRHSLEPKTLVDARKNTIHQNEVDLVLAQVNEIYACKGKKVDYLNLNTDKPDPQTINKLIIGPTGNLRAPSLIINKTLLVGFNEETFSKLLIS